jgi:hypothetical protein
LYRNISSRRKSNLMHTKPTSDKYRQNEYLDIQSPHLREGDRVHVPGRTSTNWVGTVKHVSSSPPQFSHFVYVKWDDKSECSILENCLELLTGIDAALVALRNIGSE